MPQITPIIGKEFAQKVIPLINQSKKTIDIVIFDWKWYADQIGAPIQRFNNSIIEAARRKKRIRVIANTRYTLEILKKHQIQTMEWRSRKNLHTKLLILDNQIAVIGSHNYTMNAFSLNYEVSVIINDEKAVKRLTEYFQNLWW